jgi:hypothetical protein
MLKEFISNNWQDIAVWTLFILALTYLGLKVFSHFKKKYPACNTTCKCESKKNVTTTANNQS